MNKDALHNHKKALDEYKKSLDKVIKIYLDNIQKKNVQAWFNININQFMVNTLGFLADNKLDIDEIKEILQFADRRWRYLSLASNNLFNPFEFQFRITELLTTTKGIISEWVLDAKKKKMKWDYEVEKLEKIEIIHIYLSEKDGKDFVPDIVKEIRAYGYYIMNTGELIELSKKSLKPTERARLVEQIGDSMYVAVIGVHSIPIKDHKICSQLFINYMQPYVPDRIQEERV